MTPNPTDSESPASTPGAARAPQAAASLVDAERATQRARALAGLLQRQHARLRQLLADVEAEYDLIAAAHGDPHNADVDAASAGGDAGWP